MRVLVEGGDQPLYLFKNWIMPYFELEWLLYRWISYFVWVTQWVSAFRYPSAFINNRKWELFPFDKVLDYN